MKTKILLDKSNVSFGLPVLSLKANIPQHFTLAMLQKKRAKEYGFVSFFLNDSLFPQKRFISPLSWNVGFFNYYNPEVTFEELIKQINPIERNTDLLLRTINSLLLRKAEFLNCVKEKEIIIPVISVKKDVRGFFLVPSLKHNGTKWEWWANVSENKIKNKVFVLSLQDVV